MRGLRFLLLVVLAFTVVTHLKMIVGVTDDTAKWMNRQDGIVGVHRDLRLMAVRVTVPWKPGQVRPTKLQQVYLHRDDPAQRPHRSRRLQRRAIYRGTRPRNQYCAFLRGVVRRLRSSTTSSAGASSALGDRKFGRRAALAPT